MLNLLFGEVNMFKKILVLLVLFANYNVVFSQEKVGKPTFFQYEPIRSQKHTSVTLSDLENHLPANHTFASDEIVNWCHENTHGINSLLRVKYCYPNKSKRTNAFYTLDNKFVIVEEPKITLSDVAKNIPESLRGTSYELYFVDQIGDWNDRSLYIFDEWVSFTNGSVCCVEMSVDARRASIRQMVDFNIYSICVAMTVKEQDKNYDDKELKAFLRWNIERSFEVIDKEVKVFELIDRNKKLNDKQLNNKERVIEYLRMFQLSEDANELRVFCSDYFGPEWTKKYFNF